MPLLVHQLSLFTSIFFIHYLSYARFPIDFHTLSLHAALPISTPPPRTSRRSSRQSRTRQTDYNRVLYKPNAKLGLLNGLLDRSEEHTSELQSRGHLVCRLLLDKKRVKTTEAIVTASRNQC